MPPPGKGEMAIQSRSRETLVKPTYCSSLCGGVAAVCVVVCLLQRINDDDDEWEAMASLSCNNITPKTLGTLERCVAACYRIWVRFAERQRWLSVVRFVGWSMQELDRIQCTGSCASQYLKYGSVVHQGKQAKRSLMVLSFAAM